MLRAPLLMMMFSCPCFPCFHDSFLAFTPEQGCTFCFPASHTRAVLSCLVLVLDILRQEGTHNAPRLLVEHIERRHRIHLRRQKAS